jgi:hypothetical protein
MFYLGILVLLLDLVYPSIYIWVRGNHIPNDLREWAKQSAKSLGYSELGKEVRLDALTYMILHYPGHPFTLKTVTERLGKEENEGCRRVIRVYLDSIRKTCAENGTTPQEFCRQWLELHHPVS